MPSRRVPRLDRIGGAGVLPAVALALALFAGPAAAASPDRDVGFAGWLLDLGLSEEAGRELARLALAGVEDPRFADVAARAGAALLHEDRPAAAAAAFALAAERSADPVRAERLRLAAAVGLLRAKDTPGALDALSRVEAFGSTAEVRDSARRLLCVGQLLARSAPAARACVLALVPEEDPRRLRVERLLDRLSIDPERRARLGGYLSALVPGLGQATGGDPADGGVALGVNGAWISGTVLLVLDGLPVDAGLLSLGAGLRYWIGNVEHGARAWRQAAERERSEAARELARLVAKGAGEGLDPSPGAP